MSEISERLVGAISGRPEDSDTDRPSFPLSEDDANIEKPTSPETIIPFWEYCDIGHATGQRKFWFLQFWDAKGQLVGTLNAKEIFLEGGCATQRQWTDQMGAPIWHVRETFFREEVDKVSMDAEGNIHISFGGHEDGTASVPKDYAYLVYAYHWSRNGKGRPPMGFVEFCDEENRVLSSINNKWVIVEDIPRRTWGQYPKIRLRIEKSDVGNLEVGRSYVAIIGKRKAVVKKDS
jgi:hypothetical protein